MTKGQAEHGAVDNMGFRANLAVSLSAFAVEAMATLLTLQPQADYRASVDADLEQGQERSMITHHKSLLERACSGRRSDDGVITFNINVA